VLTSSRPGPMLALLLAGAAAGAGCAQGTRADPATDRANPAHGGVLRLVHEAPQSLDPALAESVYEALPINQLFDGLVDLDPGLNVVPALASTWTISADGTEYRFRLRPGARFHDGVPVTADDVRFSIRRLLDPRRDRRTLASTYLEVVEGASDFLSGARVDLPGVQALDDRTVLIRLERPYVSFLQVLAMDGLKVVSRAAVERMGERAYGRAPIGTGPFQFVAWSDSELQLAANTDHFRGAPLLDGVEIHFPRGDGTEDLERFLAGEVDVLAPTTEDLVPLRDQPAVRIHRYHELSLSFLGMNTGFPALGDVRVRQAIAHALDREALVAHAPVVRRVATGILPPGMPAYAPDPKALRYDPDRARELLAEAGYPGGRGLLPIRFDTAARSGPAIRIQERVRQDLEQVGIRVEFMEVTWPQLLRGVQDHAVPMFMLGWVADLNDPDSFFRGIFESGGAANYFAFYDEKVGELLGSGARELNPVVRAEAYREAEQRILGLAPLVPLFHTVGLLATRSGVHGLEPGPMGLANARLEHVWIDPREGPS
jgi:ABC-type transport system substrate-binding protein